MFLKHEDAIGYVKMDGETVRTSRPTAGWILDRNPDRP